MKIQERCNIWQVRRWRLGFSTRVLDMQALDLQNGRFFDPAGELVNRCFKLYPWEWMVDESPDGCLAEMEWLEPIWKIW